MTTTTFKILRQGTVEMLHSEGYMVVGNSDAVCFYIDPIDRAYISASTESDTGCPVIYVCKSEDDEPTEIEFSMFPGWRFHAGGSGKSIAISLVRADPGGQGMTNQCKHGQLARVCELCEKDAEIDRLAAQRDALLVALNELAQSIVWKEFGECRGFNTAGNHATPALQPSENSTGAGRMTPTLYRYRDTESVVKAMDGYSPGEGWEPLYSQADIDKLQAQLVRQQKSYEAEIKVEIDAALERAAVACESLGMTPEFSERRSRPLE